MQSIVYLLACFLWDIREELLVFQHLFAISVVFCCEQQILSQMEAVAEKKAPRQPRFVQPLQNAEITEGQRLVV